MIPVRNIYYMLSYAFQTLEQKEFKDMALETFDALPDLFAQILIQGVERLIKSGIRCDYKPVTHELNTITGKMNLSESIRRQSMHKGRMVCEYEIFSADTPANRIIKCTMNLLMRSDIKKQRKQKLRRQLDYFRDIQDIPYKEINWHIHIQSRSALTRMLIGICYLTIKGLIQTYEDGSYRMMNFLDPQKESRLYEKFILEFYRAERPELHACSKQIPWQVKGNTKHLPRMLSDVFLETEQKILIIDAKYYDKSMQKHFGTPKIHSGNLYQIFTYVINMQNAAPEKEVSGMLLYAKTDENKTVNAYAVML